MRLPTMSATSTDVMAVFARCAVDWCRAMGEESTVADFTAIVNPNLPAVADANCAFSAAPLTRERIANVEAAFAERSSRCLRFTTMIDDGQSPPGFRREGYDVMRLCAWRPASEAPTGVRVLPARAAYAKTEQMMETIFADAPHEIPGAMQHLDDPRYELLLALRGGEPIATAGLLTSGDAGLVVYVVTHPNHRRQGLSRMMVDRAIEIAARAALRHVLLAVDDPNVAARTLYQGMGFEPVGRMIEHHVI